MSLGFRIIEKTICTGLSLHEVTDLVEMVRFVDDEIFASGLCQVAFCAGAEHMHTKQLAKDRILSHLY